MTAMLTQLLGLCPLLAVTTSAVRGFGLGVATALVMIAASIVISLTRGLIRQEFRIPAFMLLIGALVTAVAFTMNAWFPALYRELGIFVPLIATNCAIAARVHTCASRVGLLPAARDGIVTGFGALATLVVVGALRELLGKGTILAELGLLLGQTSAPVLDTGLHLRLFIHPPGAFLTVGLLVAAKAYLDNRRRVGTA